VKATHWTPIAALLSLLMSTGCGDEPVGEAACEVDRSAYPAGPYGLSEGEIIADLVMTNLDESDYFLSALHAESSNRLLLVSTSAGWCTACIDEQPTLAQLHEDYTDDGLVVIVAYFENSEFQPATIETAGRWKEQFNLPFDVLSDPEFVFAPYYDSRLTPMNMLVDLECMEIIRITTGNDPSAIIAIIEAKLGN
jgi:thiol-disulfide isomerase/thioredoxin